MNFHSRPIILLGTALVACSLGAGCDHPARIGVGHAGPWAARIADHSAAIRQPTRGPSIVRESIDARCFAAPQEGNTEVIACPRLKPLALVSK